MPRGVCPPEPVPLHPLLQTPRPQQPPPHAASGCGCWTRASRNLVSLFVSRGLIGHRLGNGFLSLNEECSTSKLPGGQLDGQGPTRADCVTSLSVHKGQQLGFCSLAEKGGQGGPGRPPSLIFRWAQLAHSREPPPPPAPSPGASVTSSCPRDRPCETRVLQGRSLGKPGAQGWAVGIPGGTPGSRVRVWRPACSRHGIEGKGGAWAAAGPAPPCVWSPTALPAGCPALGWQHSPQGLLREAGAEG